MASLSTISSKRFRANLPPGASGLRRRPADTVAASDVALRRLARGEAPLRLLLGELADRFVERRAYHRLAFARLDDYARERLGLSGRELQSLASVVRRLRGLPLVSDAYLGGELSWSQVRLVAAVATGVSEGDWIARARGRTVSDLVSEVALAGAGSALATPGAPGDLGQALEEATGTVEGEELVRFRIRCPARVMSLWRRAVELARRTSGADGPLWKAAEAIAAEGASAGIGLARGAPESVRSEAGSAADRGASSSMFGAAAVDRACGAGEECGDLHDLRSADHALHAVPGVGERPSGDDRHRVARAGATPREADDDLRDSRPDRHAFRPDDFGLGDLDARDFDGFGPFDLDGAMRRVVRALQELDSRSGKLLRRILDARLYRTLGFSSFDGYVRSCLGMSASRARALVVIERRADRAPALASSYGAGQTSWVRALTLLPVVAGPYEIHWIRRAREVTARQLAREVEWALENRDAAGFRGPVPPPPHGAKLTFPDLRQICARPDGEPADREVTFRGPLSVASLFATMVNGLTRDGEPRWRGFERLLRHAAGWWEAQPRHRDPVFERDEWRCKAPCCSARSGLEDHHRRYRSLGGGNELSNRLALCHRHHRHAVHENLMRASGCAPDDIVWELGLRPGRKPLLVLRGDRYLASSAAASGGAIHVGGEESP